MRQFSASRCSTESFYSRHHEAELLNEVIGEVADVIAPVWPLQHYVAVNPYAGIAHRSFMDARAFMRLFSDCDSLMPAHYYVEQFRAGQFTRSDIESAIVELSALHPSFALTSSQVVETLNLLEASEASPAQRLLEPNHARRIRTIAEFATLPSDVDWTEAVVDEISKHCAAHYDQGQATWPSPCQKLPLYQAWRMVAEYDRNIEILGLTGFRHFVARLPHTPEAAIAYLLHRLSVPVNLWSIFLLSQAFSIPGWSAWTKYQSYWTNTDGAERNDLAGLLAIRLAYDAALAEAKMLRLNWSTLVTEESVSFDPKWSAPGDDSMLRYVLLRASEIGFRSSLLRSLSVDIDNATSSSTSPANNDRKLAQVVFCIDVRSERIRRQLESQSEDIETFGFAGFFGMPFEYSTLGQESGNFQLPVLLKPQFTVREGLQDSDADLESQVVSERQQTRAWRSVWKNLQTSAVSCFSFVETLGLVFSVPLARNTLGLQSKTTQAKFDGISAEDRSSLGPTLRALNSQGFTTSRQVDLVENMLRNLGLTKNFAKLVVFCGHACQTENNSLAAGLDCGACGGHSGEPNARFAALLLNQPYIRQTLEERGIAIPSDTHFLAALHNTTTDAIQFFEVKEIPERRRTTFRELSHLCSMATLRTRSERLPLLSGKSEVDLLRRASDWSEVRPEWGLAGNAAFIVAPRSMTKDANLDARAFMHSYDYRQDERGKILETIMTAPMIVANWINLQYYASTVDNRNFGSGNKTVHNVVGRFGIQSGNGGDLMTGLPWQSLHTGDTYQHRPMRLQVVIAAPRHMIDRVITKHEVVANLLGGTWLHLVAIEEGTMYRYGNRGAWEPLEKTRCKNPLDFVTDK